MTNALIPMGPSNAEKAEMTRLMKIMNGETNVPAVQQPAQAHYSGGYSGTQRPLNESRVHAPAYAPSFGTSREEVDAMKNIMQKLSVLSEDSGVTDVQRSPERLLENHGQAQDTQTTHQGSGPYEVLISLKENAQGKEVRGYSVVDSSRRDVISGLVMQEAAQAIMRLMNKGQAFQGTKVQEVVSLEEDFNRNRLETSRHKQRYQRSIELGESAAANVFKDRFNVARANALAAQDQIKSILESIR